ncbi:MAG: bacillithiol system redox-active protein YtxJ [Thermoanaerobaculia bacterium]
MSEYSRLDSVAEIEPLIAQSRERAVLFFKHSLTCPISTAAYREYQQFLGARPEDDDTVYTLIEIQNAREVSSSIAERTGVRHQSPQALLLRDGEVAWHASHWKIKAQALADAVGG